MFVFLSCFRCDYDGRSVPTPARVTPESARAGGLKQLVGDAQ